MKLRKDFVVRQVADTWVVVPVGQAVVDFGGMLTLNESGALLWNALETGADEDALVRALTSEYDVSEDIAREDIAAFLNKLQKAGCLEV